MKLDKRQLATVLAALRYWQREGLRSDSCIEHEIATDAGAPLTKEETDALCVSLNCDPVPAKKRRSQLEHFALGAIAILEMSPEWSSDTPDDIAALAIGRGLAHLDDESMFKAGPGKKN
jgi:hypothetical protein